MLTDYNDLYCAEGPEEVRRQLELARQALRQPAANDVPEQGGSSPAPSDDEVLPRLINRYALIHGETKIWDSQDRKVIKKMAFIDLVSRPFYKLWSESPNRRVVDKREATDVPQNSYADDERMMRHVLERYIYIYPTKEVWDSKRRALIAMDTLKLAIPNHYPDWLKSPKRKVIDQNNLVFDPTQRSNPETHINTFNGLPLTPSGGAGECDEILNLLVSLCNYDHEMYDWVVKWLAYPLQHVGAKMDTALIFHSDTQGTGKSLFFGDIMTQLYGEYATVVGQHQLESQYTDWRSKLLYCVFEEIFSRDQKYSHTGTVKHMVTGKTQRIEKKFISGWEESNHMNCVFLSNEIQPFPLERSDRRMNVVWPRNKLDPGAFIAADRQAKSGGIEALYEYFLNYPLGDFSEHTKPPACDDKNRLINFGLPSWEVFYDEWSGGYLERPFVSCKSTSLFEFYKNTCAIWNERPISMQRFMGFLATRVTVAKKRYRCRLNVEGPVSFVVVGPVPPDQQEQDWLGENQEYFENE